MIRKTKNGVMKTNVPANDPVLNYEHNKLFMQEQDLRKKLIGELKLCHSYLKRKTRFCIEENQLKEF